MTGRVIMIGPPPGNYCVACLMRAKGQQWTAHHSEIEEGWAKSPDDPPTVIPWSDGLQKELGEALYRGVSGDFPQLGIVDGLCWNDVAGFIPPESSSLDTETKIPASFLRKGKPR